uniref:Putative maturase MatK, N-terminal domain-containing protein n=1 Tax=Helianthus annuus TaxID=4232 RepID=A0A1Y3BTU7_HELAN
MYVNMNLASYFSVTNLLTYDQHLLEPLLNEYILWKNRASCRSLCQDFSSEFMVLQRFFMHYVRYQGKSILASKGTFLLMNKRKDYFFNFWKSYFYLWSYPGRISINQLSNHSLDFLGYRSSVRLKPSMYAVKC